jgi:hypothetical protein
MVLKILPLPLAEAKNGDKQFCKEKFHAANAGQSNFLFFWRVWAERDFWFFFVLFPMCSHQVPKVYPYSLPKV